jgi:hypothetical protein
MAAKADRSLAIRSITPTIARPPARRAIPGGNRRAGRSLRCSRHVGTTATRTRAATPSVVPTDRTSSADSGSRASGSPWFSGTNARYAAMMTRLEIAGPTAGALNRRYACSRGPRG